MFIIKLGAEALNRLEEQLMVNCKGKLETTEKVNGNGLYSFETNPESSILYNLLSCDEVSIPRPKSLLFPDYLMTKHKHDLPPRANTISYSNQACYDQFKIAPRPYSAPEILPELSIRQKRKRKPSEIDDLKSSKMVIYGGNSSKCSELLTVNSPSMSCSTDSLADEPMDLSRTGDIHCRITTMSANDGKHIVDSWLFQLISLINSSNQQFTSNLIGMPSTIRLHLLQSSWHRIIITYLYEYLMKLPDSFPNELWKFIQLVTGTTNQSVMTKKNMSCMYKNLIDELNVILYQIKNLHLDDVSMNFLRVGLFLTGSHDENSPTNRKLIEQFIKSKINSTESDSHLIIELIDNVLNLNSVIIETILYGHLNDSVENVIYQLFTNS